MGAADIDVLELYDAFTINVILFLEDLGFCPKGEGGRFVSGGAIAPGGRLPVNTNGGGLSYCHPGMYGLLILIEAIRQLRGDCGERQVDGAETAIVHGNGGVLSAQSTVILGTEFDAVTARLLRSGGTPFRASARPPRLVATMKIARSHGRASASARHSG